jgi:hypothetical protein
MFDSVIMVDWSGNGEPKTGEDSIWIASGSHANGHIGHNPDTRQASYNWLLEVLESSVRKHEKVLIGFDFAYGYPQKLIQALALQPVDGEAIWRTLWRTIHDLAFSPHIGAGDVRNGMQKFSMANELNRLFNVASGNPVPPTRGPFWGRPDWTTTNAVLAQLPPSVRGVSPFVRGARSNKGDERRNICAAHGIGPTDNPFLAMTSPSFPLEFAGGDLARLRLTEEQATGTQETWKIYGQGSVGGQALTGIPYLYKLLTHETLAPHSRVWPFTTGFADPTADANGPLIVHAEVFPGAIDCEGNTPPNVPDVPDAKQVWSLVNQTLVLNAGGTLLNAFLQPPNLAPPETPAITSQEGWILFAE